MTDTTVQNAADLIDKWAAKLVAVAEQHGPQAAELALSVGRVGSLQTIAQGAFLIVVAGALAFAANKSAKAAANADSYSAADGYGFLTVLIGVAGIFAFGAGVFNAGNFYAWAGLWRPEVYLAAKALGL